MDKYRCVICGYVYDPEKGAGIMHPAGTAFEDLTDTWKSPVCGAPKRPFTKVKLPVAAREICDRIYSVGTIDWDLRYFDAIMPTPRGSSYNAYLVKGSEKTALIDTCKPNDEADFITNLMRL